MVHFPYSAAGNTARVGWSPLTSARARWRALNLARAVVLRDPALLVDDSFGDSTTQ